MAPVRAMLAALFALSASSASAGLGMAQAPGTPLPPYDCNAEYELWKTAWTPDWKAWCCENEQRGCPSTTTTTSTSVTTTTRTATSTTSSTSSVTTTTTESGNCDAPCQLKGRNATCAERIAWAATHDTKDEPNACVAAYVLVLSQCSVCGGCSPKAADCEHGARAEEAEQEERRSMKFRVKFDERAALSGQASAPNPDGSGLGFFARCSLVGVPLAGVPLLAVALRRGLRAASMQPELREQIYQQPGERGDEEEARE